ncbi:MAG TPA: Rdx family protein [Thermoplasmata archaeon]|nr:Rdx family protein [Thermoplasmata archaeon]HYU07179.1 Rdx family protein [Thermoplasmata archaeon]
MPEVVIHYCVPCRYQFKAIQDADAILKEFGEELSDLRLVPGAHGVYDVEVDGTLVFSLDKAMRFPETPELIRKIRAKIGTTKARRRKA